MENFVVVAEGLRDLTLISDLKKNIRVAAARAVNRTSDLARTRAARRILQQVALPASYASPSQGRLSVVKRATPDDPEAIIRARHRATSLARFVTSGGTGGQPVNLMVKPGKLATFGRRAFLIRLNSGNADLDTKANLGLAIRLKPGERVTGKHRMTKIGTGLYLLYGPSVDQIFQTVREDVSPQALADMEQEFLRLLNL